MFFVRFLVLLFLVFYGYSMGQISADGLNGFGKLMAGSFVVTAPALYLLPAYEAWRNKHPNLTSIALVNVFLGWTLLGWVVAVAWAFKKPEPAAVAVQTVEAPTRVQPLRHTKKCPFCAEEILPEAIKCKHCGSELHTASSSLP